MSSSSPQVLVIGGGLTGLAAASTLIRNGREVLLLEASDDRWLRRAPTQPNPHQSSIPTGQTSLTGSLDCEEDRYRQ
jgi:monoamine oxidase